MAQTHDRKIRFNDWFFKFHDVIMLPLCVTSTKKKKASIFSSLPNFTRAGKETFISKIPLTDKTQLLLLQLIKTLSRILLWDFFVFFFLKTLESEFLEAVFFFEDYE
jgi:hypothetical protein